MHSNLDARVSRLESAVATLPAVPQEATDADYLAYIRWMLRERQVIYTDGSWAVNPDASVTCGHDWQWLESLCNDFGGLICPITASEVDRAIAELDAGGWFWQFDTLGSRRQIDGHPWPVWGHPQYCDSAGLAGAVRSALRVWCEQVAGDLPANLEELRAWLAELREAALQDAEDLRASWASWVAEMQQIDSRLDELAEERKRMEAKASELYKRGDSLRCEPISVSFGLPERLQQAQLYHVPMVR